MPSPPKLPLRALTHFADGGDSEEFDGPSLARSLRLMLTVTLVVANLAGVVVIVVLILLVLPAPAGSLARARTADAVVAAAYLVVAIPLGFVLSLRRFDAINAWLQGERPLDDSIRLDVVRGPLRLLEVQAALWFVAVPVFGALNGAYAGALARNLVGTVAIAGATTCATAYLLSERVLRPVAARALASGLPERVALPGVAGRALLAWGLGTALPVLGLLLVAIFSLAGAPASTHELSVAILVLGGAAIVVGMLVTLLAAGATADPVRSVQRGLGRVEQGELDFDVPVYDATEIGRLQAGFNRMVAGLRERELIRDLFGRQVGPDVARTALQGGIELGGEEREVGVLFVNLIGSTALAAERPPQDVVALINRFFDVVVHAVDHEGGWVNKFAGDGALAIFGAPVALPDAAGRALAGARRVVAELAEAVPECDAAVGVSAGAVVAGHIGATERYEYTVIGDPVNEAARLTELAKGTPGHVLASDAAVARANPEEAARWTLGETVTLRGRTRPTRLAVPRTPD